MNLARTIRRHCQGILAAIRLGLSNGPLEGLNLRAGSPDQPSQLRLPRRGTPDRARLSLLRRARRHAAAVVMGPLKRVEHPQPAGRLFPRKIASRFLQGCA